MCYRAPMFVEIVSTTRSELDLIDEEAGLFSDPPEGLLVLVAWEGELTEEVMLLSVWQTPEARGEFGFRKIMPLVEAGEVVSTPKRLKPVKVWIRP